MCSVKNLFLNEMHSSMYKYYVYYTNNKTGAVNVINNVCTLYF
jgi:hypothetical protein